MEDGSLLWKTDIGNLETEATVKYSISSPTVAKGTVYVGSNDGNVYALDSTNGNIKWKFQTDSWVWSTPAYSEGVLYFGSDDKHFYALDAENGNLLWSYDTGGPQTREALSGIWGDPRVHENTVFIAAQVGAIYAFDIED